MLISVLLFFCMHRKSGGDMSEMPPDEDRCGAQYNPRVCPVTASAAGNPVPGRLNPTTRPPAAIQTAGSVQRLADELVGNAYGRPRDSATASGAGMATCRNRFGFARLHAEPAFRVVGCGARTICLQALNRGMRSHYRWARPHYRFPGAQRPPCGARDAVGLHSRTFIESGGW